MTVEGTNVNNRSNKGLAFKNNAPFRLSISKIDNTFVDNGEDLDIAIPMYSLKENSENYSMTSGSLWNYYRDKVHDHINENNGNNYRSDDEKKSTIKSFEYKTKIIGSTPINSKKLDQNLLLH